MVICAHALEGVSSFLKHQVAAKVVRTSVHTNLDHRNKRMFLAPVNTGREYVCHIFKSKVALIT